jgi:hypothetical protein
MFAMVLITEVFSVTLGQAIAALSPSIFIAAIFNPFMLVVMSLFCGITIPQPQLNVFWRYWLYYVRCPAMEKENTHHIANLCTSYSSIPSRGWSPE